MTNGSAASEVPIALDLLTAATAGAVEIVWVDGGFSPRRLSQASLTQRADENIRLISGLATGVRFRLATAATRIDLDLSIRTRVLEQNRELGDPHSPPRSTANWSIASRVTPSPGAGRMPPARSTRAARPAAWCASLPAATDAPSAR
ncbi:hypothetical protein [Parafrigoribacterium soli]|uniref:hypothetical protein n=1 Tax=Parafrigoribacterium soli TaxID=3144663 RepID=UPI0032EC6EA3